MVSADPQAWPGARQGSAHSEICVCLHTARWRGRHFTGERMTRCLTSPRASPACLSMAEPLFSLCKAGRQSIVEGKEPMFGSDLAWAPHTGTGQPELSGVTESHCLLEWPLAAVRKACG